jgi:hypothetical protein
MTLTISTDILRRDTIHLLRQIDAQIDVIKKEAHRLGVAVEQMRDNNGAWVMSPLLLAKTQAYSTLVQLQDYR